MSDSSRTPLEGLLASDLLRAHGFRHAFSTRAGGVSGAPFDTMNFGGPADAPDRRENVRRLATIGFDPGALYEVCQVHGNLVREAFGPVADVRAASADALVARRAGVAVGVRVADCVPILVADERSGAVAAIHAGWRGVAQGIVERAISSLSATSDHVLAAVGPSIGECCFEVSSEVADQIVQASSPAVVTRREGAKAMVSLRGAVRVQLLRAGLAPARIDDVPGCTKCDKVRFYSYRRDAEESGRHIAVIVAS